MRKTRRIFLSILFIFINLNAIGETLYSNYKICFGNLYIIGEENELKQLENGEYTVIDEGGRKLSVSIQNGQITGELKEYYENGELYMAGDYKNGKKEGIWKTYTESGKLWIKDEYKDDKLDGEHYKNYTSNMKFSEQGNYENGVKVGKWTEYHENGIKSSEGDYLNNKKVGKWIEWDSYGNKDAEINYVNGEIYGKIIKYKDDGSIFYEVDIDDYETKVKGYYSDGNINFEGVLIDNKKSGEWKFYDENKSILSVKKYENGILVSN